MTVAGGFLRIVRDGSLGSVAELVTAINVHLAHPNRKRPPCDPIVGGTVR